MMTTPQEMTERWVVGENVQDTAMLQRLVDETPPTMRYSDQELLDRGIPHLIRIIPALWPKEGGV
jgi:hypothetical protein